MYKRQVFKQNHLGSSFLVSVLRTLGGIVGTLLVTGLAAYAMSKKNMPGKRGLSLILIIPMYITGGLIPTYVWMYQLKLVNNFWVFILPNCFWAFNMLLMRTYFEGIPESLEESARLDGAGDLTILFRIIPVSYTHLDVYKRQFTTSAMQEIYKPTLAVSTLRMAAIITCETEKNR